VGFIGTGVMGARMCSRLIEGGYSLTIYNRTREKAEPLLARGARWAESPGEVAKASEVVCTMVGLPGDVREVMLGQDGVLENARAGALVVDMTTSEPTLAVELARVAAERETQCLDAPVSGGDVGARDGTLSIMVGGSLEAFERARPLLAQLGTTIVYQGPAGAGQHTKMVNQMLIGPMMIGVCEALSYAKHAGLDPKRVIESVGNGAAGSWAIRNLGPRILDGDFEPGFFVEHFVKDLGIARSESEKLGLDLPGLALAQRLYEQLKGHGFGRKGTQALMLEIERLEKPAKKP
jgi:3-hydroxyisobutyrate dehydrogenase